MIATLQVIAYEVDMAVHLPKTDSDGLEGVYSRHGWPMYAVPVPVAFGRILPPWEYLYGDGRIPYARLVARNDRDSVWRRPGLEPPDAPAFDALHARHSSSWA